jgi:very-short-patch-repair endonuclease
LERRAPIASGAGIEPEALTRARFISNSRSWLLEQYAHCNRAQLTDSEARLWAALGGCRLGVQFRRQVPLCGLFIVDFFAPSVGLVVEWVADITRGVDATTSGRDAKLRRLGYRVLRIDASLVMRDLLAAVSLVRECSVIGHSGPRRDVRLAARLD